MPIEIRELVIKAVVTGDSQQDRGGRGPAGGGEPEQGNAPEYSEDLIKQILDVLQENKNER